MGLGELSPWHLLIVVFVFMLLFGAKKLPDAARSAGRSLRIFKAEMQGLREDQPPAHELVTSTTPPVTGRQDGQSRAAEPVQTKHHQRRG